MPRRVQVRRACQQCRRRRTKCDGLPSCNKCETSGLECSYDFVRRKSKDSLRCEIERLKVLQQESDILLNAMSGSTTDHQRQIVLKALNDGEPRQAILQKLQSVGSPESKYHPPNSQHQSNSSPDPSDPYPIVHIKLEEHSASSLSPESMTISPRDIKAAWTPPSSTDSPLGPDGWIQGDWSMAEKRRLLKNALEWYLTPFCLLCPDLFMSDLERGNSVYCSPALINALLALAVCLDRDDKNPRPNLHNGSSETLTTVPSSASLYAEAVLSLQPCANFRNLADTQAIGVLALYQIVAGCMQDAERLARDFACAITELCLHETMADARGREYKKARANTYCAAISLLRLLYLITGPSNKKSSHLSTATTDKSSLCQDANSSSMVHLDLGRELNLHPLQPDNSQFAAAKTFQLTEWVYKIKASSEPVPYKEVLQVYVKCLEWYTSLFKATKTSGQDTPFTLFVHMYFHFCVMTLFTPYIDNTHDATGGAFAPHSLCKQAVQTILDLSVTYDRLFTLKHMSGLLPLIITKGVKNLVNGTIQC